MLWRHFQKSEVSKSQSFSCKKMRFEPFTVSTSSWAWKICRNSSIVLSLFIKMNMTDNINYSDHIINHCGIHQQVGIACHKLSVECFQHIFILILHYRVIKGFQWRCCKNHISDTCISLIWKLFTHQETQYVYHGRF